MKKYLLLFLIVICGTILISCTNNEIDSRDESPIPDNITPSFDYEGLGFKLTFTLIENTAPRWQRTDGEIDPLRNSSYIAQPQNNLSEQALVLKENFFSSEDYSFYGPSAEDLSGFFYYTDVSYVNNNLKVNFYNYAIEPYSQYSSIPSTHLDGIVSNNHTSYVLNTKYVSNRNYPIQFNYHLIFSALYFDNSFPYKVYFNQDYIFFMSKEAGFSQKYLEKFTPEYGVYLFKD
jgi:hypothetical protein